MIGARKSPSRSIKEKGLRIAIEGGVKKIDESIYLVRSDSGNEWREVFWDGGRWKCQCRIGTYPQPACIHVFAVVFSRVLNPVSESGNSCPDCGSDDLIKKGTRNNKSSTAQRYFCRNCGLNFTDRPNFYKMKANARAIVASLDLWFKGLSLAKIQDHLRAFYEVKVTRPAIYGWIRKYVELLDIYVRQLRPKLSGKWHADETQLKVNGQRRLLWNMLDNGTRFWIANCLTHRRRGQDAKRLINKSLAKAKRQPKALVTDGLGSYAIALQETVNRDHKKVRHVAKVGLSDGRNNIIESFHGTLRERTKVMRGLDNRKSAQLYAKGMNVFYNYIRPHTALDGATPAEAAGIHLAEGDNRWLNLLRRKKQDRLRYA